MPPSHVCSANIHSCSYWPLRFPKLWLLVLLPKNYMIQIKVLPKLFHVLIPGVAGSSEVCTKPVDSCHMTQVVGYLVAVI